MAAKTINSPHPTAVYTRTGKGILAVKNRTAKLPAQLEELFQCIDGKASVADLGAQSNMEAKELAQALDALEEHGYIKVFRQGGDQSYSDFTEAPDLDFTTPGSLLEMSVREAAKAKELAEQASRDTTVAAAEPQPEAHPETPAQHEALDARIRDLERQLDTERAARESAEKETEALRRARNDIVKTQAQAKASAAEERRAREEAEAGLDTERRTRETLQAELDAERRARAEVEANASAERERREKATQALLEVQRIIGLWKDD